MTIATTLLVLSGFIIAALLIRPLFDKTNLPYSVGMIIMGFASAELIVFLGYDTGIRAELFHDLIFYVFLPILVFQSAFNIDADKLMDNLFVILFLSIPVLLLSTLVAAMLLYVGIGHSTGFPFIAALLTGALLSATDPSSVVEMMRRAGLPNRVCTLLEGESLLNDGSTIVLFSIVLFLAKNPTMDVSNADIIVQFMLVFFGGIVSGLVIGIVFLILSRRFDDPVIQGVLTLIAAYVSYLFSETVIGVSGVMSVMITAIIIGRMVRSDVDRQNNAFVDQLWQFNTFIANALVYLLMGATITLAMFEQRWLAIIIGIFAIIISRIIAIYGTMPLINMFADKSTPLKEQHMLAWGGLRGSVTLALALSIPTDLEYWWTIQSIAFGVVIFTLFIQAPSLYWYVKKSP